MKFSAFHIWNAFMVQVNCQAYHKKSERFYKASLKKMKTTAAKGGSYSIFIFKVSCIFRQKLLTIGWRVISVTASNNVYLYECNSVMVFKEVLIELKLVEGWISYIINPIEFRQKRWIFWYSIIWTFTLLELIIKHITLKKIEN